MGEEKYRGRGLEGAHAGKSLGPLGEGRMVWACSPAHCQITAGSPNRSTVERPGRSEKSQLLSLLLAHLVLPPMPLGQREEGKRLEAGPPLGQAGRAGGYP